jgi:hypothetical protein
MRTMTTPVPVPPTKNIGKTQTGEHAKTEVDTKPTDTATAIAIEFRAAVARRLHRDGYWTQAEPIRDQLMKEARAKGLTKADAQDWTYNELDRLFPHTDIGDGSGEGDNHNSAARDTDSNGAPARNHLAGLADLPADWPALPANASLQAELGWVQANRLGIVDQRPSGAAVVRLDQAESPAPSLAALGWLETSIRSYAKYVDVVARSLATQQDEQLTLKRERMAIDDVRELLATMLDD